jgi:hypothetical protein
VGIPDDAVGGTSNSFVRRRPKIFPKWNYCWPMLTTYAAPACTERSERVAAPSCPEKPPVAGSKGAPRAREISRLWVSLITAHESPPRNHCSPNRHIPLLEFAVNHSKQTLGHTSNRHTSTCLPSPFPVSSRPPLPALGISLAAVAACPPALWRANRPARRLEIAATHSKQTVEPISNRPDPYTPSPRLVRITRHDSRITAFPFSTGGDFRQKLTISLVDFWGPLDTIIVCLDVLPAGLGVPAL